MKKVLFPVAILALCASFLAFTLPVEKEKATIEWHTWEEAIAKSKENPKKIFIDIYTDWCGWCKVMDKKTFTDKKVIEYMNENFYAVKFDAEQKEVIEFDGHEFAYINSGRRGVHELAYSLLDGRLGYPSVVYLDEDNKRISVSPGYKEAKGMINELQFVAEEHYKTTSFEKFVANLEGGEEKVDKKQ